MLNQKRQAAAPRVHPNKLQDQVSRLKRRGHGSLNAELFQKLYFSTESRTALPDRGENAELKLPVQPSMKQFVAAQGAGYVKVEADAPKRSQCTYAREYHTMPLDAAPVLNELRGIIAQNSRTGSSTNQVVPGLSLSSATSNRAFYGSYGDKPVRAETIPAVLPECGIRINRDAKFMESKTVFQKDYKWHSQGSRMNIPEPSTRLDSLANKNPGTFNGMTSYKRVFGDERAPRYPGLQKSQSVPADALQAARARQAAAFSGR